MADESSTKEEQLRRKINITQAAMEGSKSRIESYNGDDEVARGLFWAFEELKEAAVAYMESN